MTSTTNVTPVTDRVFAAMRADVMYCPSVEDMAAVIRERGSVLPDAGAVWAVWHREDDGSLVLCEFDGCVCYTAHRTREAAVKAAAETNDCYRCEKYVAAIVPAGIACCLGDDMADTMRAGGGDFEWSAFMEGGFICLRVPAPNMSIAPASASATPLPCHLIPTPSGRFAFVGRVPADLAFAASNPDYVATALQCGPGIAQKQAAREGGTFRTLSWATEADAYAYAAGLGYAVPATAEERARDARNGVQVDTAERTMAMAREASGTPAMVPQPVQQQQARDMRATATPDVSSRYGAPMGRRSATMPNLDTAEKIQLSRIRLNSGGYDAGGSYWGLGAPLWCAMDHTGETAFFRARDREAAKAHVRDEHDTPEQVRFYR